MYSLEIQLVEDFKNNLLPLDHPFRITELADEFNYLNGRVDVIAKSEEGLLIAFEAKLKKWRIALNQAYRNSSFAHLSYVVLPTDSAMNALKNYNEFLKRGVGLCSVNSEGIKIEINAKKNKPLQPWLTDSAFNFIASA